MKRLLILVAWFCTTAWFVRFEAFPGYFTHSLNGYRDIIPQGIVVKDTWMRLLLKNSPVGYSHSRIETDDDNAISRYRVENLLMLNLNLMGMRESITVSTDVRLDVLYRLTSFRMAALSRHSSTIVHGRRSTGNTFDVTVDAGGAKDRRSLSIPDDVVVYSPGMDLAMSRMKPGESMTTRTLEPLTLSPTLVTIRALPRETIEFRGGKTNVAVFAVEYMGSSSQSWIGDNSTILRAETLLKDLVVEACGAEEAMASVSTGADAEDLLNALAVHPNVAVTNPRECTLLKLRVRGVSSKSSGILSNRQTIEDEADGAFLLTVRAAGIPATVAAVPPGPERMKDYLGSSPFIQATEPDIVKLATSLTAGKTNVMDSAIAICNWVYKNIEKVASPGVPSAAEVLRTRRGDCNEHTYLFVALARAAGIPASVKIGLAYSEAYEAFCYHAWPAVYAGDWIEMDPTFGQTAVDAAHIALIEGEFAEQFALAQMVGRLNVTVLAQERK
ncbi:MAG: transglutaminase-like domain-containing protein [bacterium]